MESQPLLGAQHLPKSHHHVEDTSDSPTDVIFLVKFDPLKGNIVEWHHPETADVSGVEFKAIASGMHNCMEDSVYFSHRGGYGISVLNQVKDATEHRGARIRSVGIITRNHWTLKKHLNNLTTMSKKINSVKDADVTELENYFKQATQTGSAIDEPTLSSLVSVSGPGSARLWKAMLLQLRVLFIVGVPLAPARRAVDGCYSMVRRGGRADEYWEHMQHPKRMYYINLEDFDLVSRERSYVAYTTEKIFESKTKLWDVLVVGDKLTVNPEWAAVLAPSASDAKFCPQSLDDKALAEKFDLSNYELFRTLHNCAGNPMRELKEHGWCNDDVPFINALCKTYNIPQTAKKTYPPPCCCI